MSRPRVVDAARISLGPKRGACKISGAVRFRFETANSKMSRDKLGISPRLRLLHAKKPIEDKQCLFECE